MSSPFRPFGAGSTRRARQIRRVFTAIVAVLMGHGAFGARPAHAQLSYRGLVEIGVTGYPQSAPNDPTQGVSDVLARFEPSIDLTPGISVAASFEARMDSHGEVARRWDVDYWD